MSTTAAAPLADAATRVFPPFSLERLLRSVFTPTEGRKVCILIDLPELDAMKDYAFLKDPEFAIQGRAYEHFFQGLHRDGVMQQLGMTGGEMYAYEMTYGSNLDLTDECRDKDGNILSLENDVYPEYDIILCISTWSATAPLTAHGQKYNFRGATLHGVNEIILNSGLAVDYDEVSRDAEKLRLALTKADEVEIDFQLENRGNPNREAAVGRPGSAKIPRPLPRHPAGHRQPSRRGGVFCPRRRGGLFPHEI